MAYRQLFFFGGGGCGGERKDCLEVTWVAMSFVSQLTIQVKLIDRVPWAFQFNWSLDIVSGKGLSSPFCYCIATICYVMPAFRKSIFSRTTCESSERNWYDIRPEKWAWTAFKVSWDKKKPRKFCFAAAWDPIFGYTDSSYLVCYGTMYWLTGTIQKASVVSRAEH